MQNLSTCVIFGYVISFRCWGAVSLEHIHIASFYHVPVALCTIWPVVFSYWCQTVVPYVRHARVTQARSYAFVFGTSFGYFFESQVARWYNIAFVWTSVYANSSFTGEADLNILFTQKVYTLCPVHCDLSWATLIHYIILWELRIYHISLCYGNYAF